MNTDWMYRTVMGSPLRACRPGREPDTSACDIGCDEYGYPVRISAHDADMQNANEPDSSPDPMPRAREPNEMVERVARAIYITSHVSDWDDPMPNPVREAHRCHARAAIAAMREPTQAMRDLRWIGSDEVEAYQAIIDEALAPQDG